MNNREIRKPQNTFVSILNISASIASLAAFVVMIFEKTDFPIKWGSLAGGLMFGLSLISIISGTIYILRYIRSDVLKDKSDLIKFVFWPISILIICFFLFLIVSICYIILYDGISTILNNLHFV